MEIQDEIIKPYKITFSNNNYDVIETLKKLDKDGKATFKSHGHFSSVENALAKIVKLFVEVNKTYTVKQYIEEIKRVKQLIIL